MAPARAGHPCPPVLIIAEVDRPGGLLKDHRARHEVLHGGTGKIRGIERTLGERAIAGSLDEASELLIGRLVAVDPETIDSDIVDRTLLRIEVLRTHPKSPARYPDHAGMRWIIARPVSRPGCLM